MGDTVGDEEVGTDPESFIDRLRRENALAAGGIDAVPAPGASPPAHSADPSERADPDGLGMRDVMSGESPDKAEGEGASASEPTHRMPPRRGAHWSR